MSTPQIACPYFRGMCCCQGAEKPVSARNTPTSSLMNFGDMHFENWYLLNCLNLPKLINTFPVIFDIYHSMICPPRPSFRRPAAMEHSTSQRISGAKSCHGDKGCNVEWPISCSDCIPLNTTCEWQKYKHFRSPGLLRSFLSQRYAFRVRKKERERKVRFRFFRYW